MASPMPVAHLGNWGGQGQQSLEQQALQQNTQQMSPPATNTDDQGPQTRLMGLKVTYTIDREAQHNYLARHPQPLHVQTIPLDDGKTIGIVNLKNCAECIANCSPEIFTDNADFTVYAYDFSEPDTPLVGQGMLSWILEADPAEGKIVIGRVTKNLLAAFGGGIKETLEVKFKLLPTARIAKRARPEMSRSESNLSMDMSQSFSQGRPQEDAMTPTGAAEWNSFLQSNPQLGQPPSHAASRVASPALSFNQSQPQSQSQTQNRAEFPTSVYNPVPHRQDPFSMPGGDNRAGSPAGSLHQADGPVRIAPTPVDTSIDQANAPSRPDSRASNKSTKSATSRRRPKPPTGRPRGRPRRKPLVENPGSTSGYEEGTDGEEAPAAKKRRVTTMQANRQVNAAFGGGADSLRITASTADSLRTLRPPGSLPEATQGSHLQEMPRAPTPVPEGGPLRGAGSRPSQGSSLRRQSTLSQAATVGEQQQQQPYQGFGMSPPSQDGRSPESDVPTPMYSGDSPAPIGSSPPVPRTTNFIRSSPPASSPILPPMPKPQPDSGFMSGGPEDVVDEAVNPLQLPPPQAPAPTTKAAKQKKPQRKKNKSNVPVQVWKNVITPQTMSSEADLQQQHQSFYAAGAPPTSTPALPPLNRAHSDMQMGLHTLASLPRSQNEGRLSEQPQNSNQWLQEPTRSSNEPQNGAKPQESGNTQLGEEHITESTEKDFTSNELPAPSAEAPGHTTPRDFACNESQTSNDNALLQQLRSATTSFTWDSSAAPEADMHEHASSFMQPPPPIRELSRTESAEPVPGALANIPASDPVGPLALPSLPRPDTTSFSEALAPPSDAAQPSDSKTRKNFVKKQSIKMRLAQAVASGEMPPYCTNCGAIETTTWRKIWTQEKTGEPELYDLSGEPGQVTAVIVLERNDDQVTKHQVLKKSLASTDDKSDWTHFLLCNPCGIWLAKWKAHRPQDRWHKESGSASRSKRGGANRAPKSRAKKGSQANPTSEANLPMTEPAGPPEADTAVGEASQDLSQQAQREATGESRSREASLTLDQVMREESQVQDVDKHSNPGSSHSRDSGISKSPSTFEKDDNVAAMGATRRLLFPSPRKQGEMKVLHDVAINVVQTSPTSGRLAGPKDVVKGKENTATDTAALLAPEDMDVDDDLEALFRSPIAPAVRPSTPPPKEQTTSQGPFKTPTRPTPSHRPITRSISRSVRSSRSRRSGGDEMLQRTPTRTPRSVSLVQAGDSPSLRRSPRFNQGDDSVFETPMTRSLNLLLSEAHDMDIDVSTLDFDFGSLPELPADGVGNMIDFGNLLSTDAMMPSSSPRAIRQQASFDYNGTASFAAEWIKHGDNTEETQSEKADTK